LTYEVLRKFTLETRNNLLEFGIVWKSAEVENVKLVHTFCPEWSKNENFNRQNSLLCLSQVLFHSFVTERMKIVYFQQF